MIRGQSQLQAQVELIVDEMKLARLWSESVPSWVFDFRLDAAPDVWQWLQYVYLPMRISEEPFTPHYIAPLIARHLGPDPGFHKLLTLFIELDSLTSSISSTAP